MKNKISVLKQTELLGQQFNVYGSPEEPLFLAKDVAVMLSYDLSSINKLVALVDDDEKERNVIPTHGGKQEMWFITEDGLYEVLMQSRKPIAKQFKKGVKLILKEIRLNGGYITSIEDESPEDLMARALVVAKATLARTQKQKELAEAERDEAIATKAWINGKKAATAMNTASQLSKENKKLKIEVDRSKDYATITTVEKLTKKRYRWQELRNYCNAHELDMPKVADKRYGTVRSYPAEAWLNVYGVSLNKIL